MEAQWHGPILPLASRAACLQLLRAESRITTAAIAVSTLRASRYIFCWRTYLDDGVSPLMSPRPFSRRGGLITRPTLEPTKPAAGLYITRTHNV